MSLPRFYIEPSNWSPDRPVLTGPEAHHARDVLRLKAGDRAVLFDGRGHEITAEVAQLRRGEIELTTLEQREAPPRACQVALSQSIPKGKNMDLIVQKAVELGAAEIVPLISERTVVSLDGAKSAEKKQAKWQQIAIEAAKQCGQSWMPELAEPLALPAYLQRPEVRGRKSDVSDLKLVASLQEDSLHLKEVLREYEAKHDARPVRVTMLIGPEGDLTEAEYAAARAAGFQPITLGSTILRVETAAIYCLSVLSYELMNPPE